MSAAMCTECGKRPKAKPRHRCITCLLRHAPVGDQVEAAQRRRGMVPDEMHQKRTKAMQDAAPRGTAWCAGCQSYRDDIDFRGAYTQCWACRSAKTHASSIERTYGLTSSDYDKLLRLQGGKCAICRQKPKSKRLAVDHDHKTGAVRGLCCSRCNHDLMGSAWDSIVLATALWHYLNTPPASGSWVPPERAPALVPGDGAPAGEPNIDFSFTPNPDAPAPPTPRGTMVLPMGARKVPGKPGIWEVYVEPEADAPF